MTNERLTASSGARTTRSPGSSEERAWAPDTQPARRRTAQVGFDMGPDVFVHESALCETESIGRGTRVWAFAHVMDGALIGEDCNICDHVFVESGAVVGDRVTVKNGVMLWDGVTLEDEVFVGPGAVFTNVPFPRVAQRRTREEFLPTVVRHGASLGAGTVVVCGVEIGEFALVGAGSVVVTSIPPHALAYGNPARQVGWACECGIPLDGDLSCPNGHRYRTVDNDTRLELARDAPPPPA